MVDETEASGTREGHVGIRRWDRNNRGDCRLEALVDAILANCGDAHADSSIDVREAIPALKTAINAQKDRPMPVLTPTSSMDGYFEEYPVRKNAGVCQFFAQCGYCKYVAPPAFLLSHRWAIASQYIEQFGLFYLFLWCLPQQFSAIPQPCVQEPGANGRIYRSHLLHQLCCGPVPVSLTCLSGPVTCPSAASLRNRKLCWLAAQAWNQTGSLRTPNRFGRYPRLEKLALPACCKIGRVALLSQRCGTL